MPEGFCGKRQKIRKRTNKIKESKYYLPHREVVTIVVFKYKNDCHVRRYIKLQINT